MDTLLKNTRDWLQTSTRRSFSAVLEEAKITPRQVEICELKFVKGLTNYQIAMQLNVSVKTVDKELNTAYKQITNVLSFLKCNEPPFMAVLFLWGICRDWFAKKQLNYK